MSEIFKVIFLFWTSWTAIKKLSDDIRLHFSEFIDVFLNSVCDMQTHDSSTNYVVSQLGEFLEWSG